MTDLMEIRVEPNAPLIFNTNFQEFRTLLKEKLEPYVGMKVTDATFNQCDLVRKQCVSLRIMLESRKKDAIKMFITLPRDTLTAEFQELLDAVAEVELGIKSQMDVYDEERKEDIRAALDDYKARLQEECSLRDKFLANIEYPKAYFNKTQKEADSRADLKMQFATQKALQEEEDTAIELISKECKKNLLLNPEHWIGQLEYRSPAAVLGAIGEELERLSSMGKETKKEALKLSEPVKENWTNVTVSFTVSKRKEKEFFNSLSSFLKEHKYAKGRIEE